MNMPPFRPRTGQPSRRRLLAAVKEERDRRKEQGIPLSDSEMDARIKSLTRKR